MLPSLRRHSFRSGTPETDYDKTRRFSNVTPRPGFDYHFIDHVMGRVTHSRGFKSGGFDMRGDAAADPSTERLPLLKLLNRPRSRREVVVAGQVVDADSTVFASPHKDVQITN